MNRRDALKGMAAGVCGAMLPPRARWATGELAAAQALRRSDVVFMYEASRARYAEYGATVLAWGGKPTPTTLREAGDVAFYGSVGMVTEFGDYYDSFPDRWSEGRCLDLDGHPIKVPWLTDQQHAGQPYWWCCTRQPVFRAYLEERVAGVARGGARGVHVDDHLGSAGALFLSACFCGRCVEEFRAHLAALSPDRLRGLGVSEPAGFDAGAAIRAWRDAAPPGAPRQVREHPLWREWAIYQLRGAAAYMGRLRALAAREAGRPVPMSANAGVLWPNHLADYEAVDFFSAEIDHDAASRALSARPIVAYRLADAVDRMIAATATGQDWAFIKAEQRHGLARSWVAQAYAAGQMLMAPNRQWCYTEALGTHWYEGSAEVFAPVYRFVREEADLLDGFGACADVGLVWPHRAFTADPARWIAIGEALASKNVSFRILLGGDEIVNRRIDGDEASSLPLLCSPEPAALDEADRATLARAAGTPRTVSTLEEVAATVAPVVSVPRDSGVRLLPRLKPGRAAVHLVNTAYDPATDRVTPRRGVVVDLDLGRLGVRGARQVRVVSPDAAPSTVPIRAGRVVVDVPGAWSILDVRS